MFFLGKFGEKILFKNIKNHQADVSEMWGFEPQKLQINFPPIVAFHYSHNDQNSNIIAALIFRNNFSFCMQINFLKQHINFLFAVGAI